MAFARDGFFLVLLAFTVESASPSGSSASCACEDDRREDRGRSDLAWFSIELASSDTAAAWLVASCNNASDDRDSLRLFRELLRIIDAAPLESDGATRACNSPVPGGGCVILRRFLESVGDRDGPSSALSRACVELSDLDGVLFSASRLISGIEEELEVVIVGIVFNLLRERFAVDGCRSRVA